VRHQLLFLEEKHQRTVAAYTFLRLNPEPDLIIDLTQLTTRIHKAPKGYTQLLNFKHIFDFEEAEDVSPQWIIFSFFIGHHFVRRLMHNSNPLNDLLL